MQGKEMAKRYARAQYSPGMTWWDYLQRISDGAPQVQIARAAKVEQSAVSRWKSGGHGIRPENAANVARHYGRPVLEAFVAAGFLTPEEASAKPALAPALDELSDEELLQELLRRRTEHIGPSEALAKGRGQRQSANAQVLSREEDDNLRGPEPPLDVAARDEHVASRGERVRRHQDNDAEAGE
jgi:transcriptional regulator with XRE-family HTH domain